MPDWTVSESRRHQRRSYRADCAELAGLRRVRCVNIALEHWYPRTDQLFSPARARRCSAGAPTRDLYIRTERDTCSTRFASRVRQRSQRQFQRSSMSTPVPNSQSTVNQNTPLGFDGDDPTWAIAATEPRPMTEPPTPPARTTVQPQSQRGLCRRGFFSGRS